MTPLYAGLICILRKPKLSAERMHVDDISTELKRVEAARIVAAEQLQQLYELFLDKIGESNAQIFNIHMMMLEDEDYNGSIEGMIRSEQVNAEYAVARTSDVFAQMLEAMDNEYMAGAFRRCPRRFKPPPLNTHRYPHGFPVGSGKLRGVRRRPHPK